MKTKKLFFFAALFLPALVSAENNENWSLGAFSQFTVAHADDARLPGGGLGVIGNNHGWFWGRGSRTSAVRGCFAAL